MNKSQRLTIFWIVMLATIAFDQWIKAWVRGHLNQGQSWSGGPWHGVFEITLTYNKGIAFGMLQGGGLIMTPIAIIIAGFAIRAIYKNANESTWGTIALGLLASGALGNLIDRLFNSKMGVTDMFLLRLGNITHGRMSDFPVFNVADSCISVAMVMLLIAWSKQSADEKESPGLVQEPVLEDSSL
jgi:signal peptidase II